MTYNHAPHIPTIEVTSARVRFTREVMQSYVGWLNRHADSVWVPRSTLIHTKFGEVYMRRDRTALRSYGTVIETITMSRVDILPEFQSQGLYRTLCAAVDSFADVHDWGVGHENVHEPQLQDRWERLGYYQSQDFPACYVRLPKSMRT